VRNVLLPIALLLAGCCSHGAPKDESPRPVAAAPAPAAKPVAAAPAKAAPATEIAYTRRQTVTVEADDADLREVIDQIARQAGVNIVVEPQIHEKVTIHLRDIYWLEAVQVIAQLTKCELNELRGGVYSVINPPRVTIHSGE
jgi:hypothetical protein